MRASIIFLTGLAIVALQPACSDPFVGRPTADLTSFAFLAEDNPELPADVSATIEGTSIAAIAAIAPFGADVTALKATFSITGTTVSIGATQASGVTANDFTSPVTYTVTAPDDSTRDYTVTVAVALDPAKDAVPGVRCFDGADGQIDKLLAPAI